MQNRAKRFCALSLLGLAATIAFGNPAVAASGGCVIDRRERAVLTPVLHNIAARSRSTIVIESRTDSSHFAKAFSLNELILHEAASELSPQMKAAPSGSVVILPNPTPAIPPKAQHELEQEYSAKLNVPCNIPAMRSFSKHVLFEAPTHVREMFLVTAPGKGWERFHKFFGKDAERITVSRVAFDRANHYALVHVSAGISANGAGGELFLLRRETGKWTIKRTFPTWTT